MEFRYNNAKNVNIDYISFKLKYDYYLHVSFEDKVNFYLKSCKANKLIKKQKNLMSIY